MKKDYKTPLIGFAFCSLVPLLIYFLQEKIVKNKFDECAIYTVADITKVYKLRGIIYAKYSFKINNSFENSETSVGPTDTGEWWDIDRQKLSKRRLFIVASCKNYKINRVDWDISIPDTLKNIPSNGWDTIPYGLDKIKK